MAATTIARMTVSQPARIHAVAFFVATVAALLGRSWLQLELLAAGLQEEYAADLSYLVVPPILLALLAPVLFKDRDFLAHQFRPAEISRNVILTAVGVGLLMRLLWWSNTIAGISFGFITNTDPIAVEGPVFGFRCSAPHVVALGILVRVLMIPVIEEVTNRAYIQTTLRCRGPVPAVLGSATLFAILHPPASWLFTFVAGVVLGIQYWRSGSLWPSVVTHATINTLIQIDWRCLSIVWNPRGEDLPIPGIGIPAIFAAITSIIGIAWLLKRTSGRPAAPMPSRSQSVCDPLDNV